MTFEEEKREPIVIDIKAPAKSSTAYHPIAKKSESIATYNLTEFKASSAVDNSGSRSEYAARELDTKVASTGKDSDVRDLEAKKESEITLPVKRSNGIEEEPMIPFNGTLSTSVKRLKGQLEGCLLYTSDAADE